MPKVVPITTHADLVPPAAVLRTLQGLWAASVIGQDAFFLAAQVCHRMHVSGVRQIVYTGEAAKASVTFLEGHLWAGRVASGVPKYVEALQDLHFRVGLLNALTEDALDDPYVRPTHFTLSPALSAGRHYSHATPIYFRLVTLSTDEFFSGVNSMVVDSLAGSNRIQATL